MQSLEEYIAQMDQRVNSSAMTVDNNNRRTSGDELGMMSLAERLAAQHHHQKAAGVAGGPNASAGAEDLWNQLQQKETDLLLAAELGKALLEKNEELKRQQDATAEEYNKKIEALEQERHLLRRKLANRESEFEARIVELQNDVAELSKRLSEKESTVRQWERDKSQLVCELNAQNSRLTAQLKDAAQLENHLLIQVEQLKEQCALGKTNLHEHISSVDGLREELEMLTDKNRELDRRLQLTLVERDHLATALEEATDRLIMYERQTREQEMRLQQSLHNYTNKVDHHPTQPLLGPTTNSAADDFVPDPEHRSLLAEMDTTDISSLSQECMSVCRQLRSLLQQLKSHNHNDDDDDSGLHSDCSGLSLTESDLAPGRTFSAGLVSEIAQELVNVVLDTDVVRLLERLEQARRDLQERDSELSRRSDLIAELNSRISVCEVELQAAIEERDRARRDVSHSTLAQDDAVARAREERDAAVQRRTKVEKELARTRVDLMQTNGQLIEAIQQKVELNQQLEQWQTDMQELLDEQLRNKLTSQERKMRRDQLVNGVTPQSATATTPNSTSFSSRRRYLFSFFQR